MRKLKTQKGFTLVELAIVMTIIGLLIGGILRGQELMNTARVTATIAQIKAFEAATTTFRDAYNAFPGDLGAQANQRIAGCTLSCNNTTAGTGGDGIVGTQAWNYAAQLAAATSPAAATASTTTGNETWLYWMHLGMGGLIGGVDDTAITQGGITWQWTITHPPARINGGFNIGNGTGIIGPGSTQAAGTGPSNLLLIITAFPNVTLSNAMTDYPLTPAQAAQMDRKIDDGRPGTGSVQGFGRASTAAGGNGCYITGAASPTYNESAPVPACGLLLRIQG